MSSFKNIKQLGAQCIQDPTKIDDLLECIKYKDPKAIHIFVQTCGFVFVKLIENQDVNAKSMEFLEYLTKNLNGDARVSITCWETYIKFVCRASELKHEFQNNLFLLLVKSTSLIPLNDALLNTIAEILNSADEFRYYFYKNLAKLPNSNMLILLSKLAPPPDDEPVYLIKADLTCNGTKSDFVKDPASYKKVFSDCWISILKCKLNEHEYRLVLEIAHQKIIPFLKEPVMLMDFLVDAYDQGGISSILALNGIFTLIQQHNLDFPNFYEKLYLLFDNELLHLKYRSRFFRMARIFLSSTHIPSSLVAAFIKRMMRLCLFAPPAGIIIVLPLVFNLLKQHPTCITIIHTRQEEAATEETNPNLCRATESSLWEILLLQRHYNPTVSKLAFIFQDSLSKPAYDLEDFLDHSYKTMIDAELKIKKENFALGNNEFNLDGSLWQY